MPLKIFPIVILNINCNICLSPFQNKFKEHNYQVAMNVLANAGDAAKAGDHKGGRKGGPKGGVQTNCFKIVKMIMERNLAPVIVFSFSKKVCF